MDLAVLTWLLAADDFSRYGIGGSVVGVATAVVYLASRLLRANDRQVERQLAPAWEEITTLRHRIRRLERDRWAMLEDYTRRGLAPPEEVLADD